MSWTASARYSRRRVLLTCSSRRHHCIPSRSETLEPGFSREAVMSSRHRTKFVHEGEYVAAVDVELIESEAGWAPYLSIEDAQKLDAVREALQRGDFKLASQFGSIYQLAPVAL